MKKLTYIILAVSLILASCDRDPVADFFVSRNIVDVGESVYFTNNSIDADYFEWDFGDGTRSTAFSTSHIYTQPGTYQVSLFAYNGSHWVDKAYSTITVLQPTELEVIVLEYWDEYPVVDASVLLYNTLDDWNTADVDLALVEGFTNQYGEVIFSNLFSQRYYLDVWEAEHHNYWLADEDIGWIETHVLVPNELNTFYAYVDYDPGNMKSSGERDRSVAKIRKLEKVDPRKFEEKKESIRQKMLERESSDERTKTVDEKL